MAIEEGVGEIFKALKETNQLDNTVIVLTSDNGYFYGEHGLSVERRLAYEESARIPLLMRYPRMIRAGSTVEQMALNIDIAPTVLEIAGAGALGRVHGRSLAPLLKGNTKDWRSSFLIEYFSDKVFPRVSHMGYQAVRTERWKYIHYTELSGMDELYDLRRDPYEMENAIGAGDAQGALKQMQQELKKILAATPA
jgi:N-acetylglucosamine-6-sulfatase